MLILAFETSAKSCSAAIHDGQKLLAESYQNAGLTHSQTLMVMAEDLLKVCGKTAADVTHLAVAAGPGSFTGVRIGVSAAKGFAWARKSRFTACPPFRPWHLALGSWTAVSAPAWMPAAIRSTMSFSWRKTVN